MRSRHTEDGRVAELTRRRLAALTAELAAARGEPLPEPAAQPVTEPAPLAPAAGDADTPAASSAAGRHARRALPLRRRASGWLGDRLPAGLHGRAHLGSAQVGLVCLVVAVGLVLGAWWLVRAGGATPGEVVPPRPVTAPSDPAEALTPPAPDAPSTPASGSTGQVATGAGEGQIVVDVVGKVRRPGIVVLGTGARVVDAVRAAGGIRPGVDRAAVNMARLLTDGEQLVVGASAPEGPAPGPVADPAPPGAGSALVNLNTADQAGLESLPGVGPVTAAAILEWRAEHGAFTAVEELLEVSGIGDATLAEIAPHVTL
jgi:competence protein ComEA